MSERTAEPESHSLLLVRFLGRTEEELKQMRFLLIGNSPTVESSAVTQIERIAHKISATAEPFGFPEIGAIAGAIEFIAHLSDRTGSERLELTIRLAAQFDALEVHLRAAISDCAAAA